MSMTWEQAEEIAREALSDFLVWKVDAVFQTDLDLGAVGIVGDKHILLLAASDCREGDVTPMIEVGVYHNEENDIRLSIANDGDPQILFAEGYNLMAQLVSILNHYAPEARSTDAGLTTPN